MTPIFLLFGLVVGSFLNVCIHRMQRDESLVHPRSRCPRCKKPIAWYDNVPILSWILLGGRCRHCRKPISARYPLIELLTGTLFAALAWRWEGQPLWAAAAAAACGALVVVAFIDWDTFLIPDVLSVGLAVGGVLVSPINPILGGSAAARIPAALVGAAAGFALCWGIAAFGEWVFKKEAMGGGDIKLLAGVGAWTGALGAFDCLIVASLLGSLYGGALLARRKVKRQDPIPFGPFLSAAAVANFFYVLPFGFPFDTPAFAADEPPAAILRTMGGPAFRQAGGDRFVEKLDLDGRRMDPGDELKTPSWGRAHVALPLGVVGLVAPAATFGFDRGGTDAQAAVLEGEALFALARPFDKKWRFSVRTPAAVATSRHGVFRVRYAADRSTLVTVLRGSARVRAEGRSVRVDEGREALVRWGETPLAAKPFEPASVSTATFAIDDSLSGGESAWETPRY
ncbi:MAG: prepilin peptidase [Elusimicrobia bacterium]|nr:prepilin peptidase [Elusimicrobiota bacterium]